MSIDCTLCTLLDHEHNDTFKYISLLEKYENINNYDTSSEDLSNRTLLKLSFGALCMIPVDGVRVEQWSRSCYSNPQVLE